LERLSRFYISFFCDVPIGKWRYAIALVSVHFSVWIVVLSDIYNMVSRNMDSRPISWLAPRMDTVRQYLNGNWAAHSPFLAVPLRNYRVELAALIGDVLFENF
jgi:hypothetical protein